MRRRWLIGAALGCTLVLAGFLYLRLSDVDTGVRVAVVAASVLAAGGVVWLVGHGRGGER